MTGGRLGVSLAPQLRSQYSRNLRQTKSKSDGLKFNARNTLL